MYLSVGLSGRGAATAGGTGLGFSIGLSGRDAATAEGTGHGLGFQYNPRFLRKN